MLWNRSVRGGKFFTMGDSGHYFNCFFLHRMFLFWKQGFREQWFELKITVACVVWWEVMGIRPKGVHSRKNQLPSFTQSLGASVKPGKINMSLDQNGIKTPWINDNLTTRKKDPACMSWPPPSHDPHLSCYAKQFL